MVNVNSRAAVGVGIGIIAAVMVVFMLQRPVMYPIWTVVMIGAVAALAFLTAFRTTTGS